MSSASEKSTVYERVQESTDFQELRRRFRNFAFPLTAAFLGWYLLYVIMSGWARDFMGTKLFGHINVALVFGILQFVSTFTIAWLYSRHAGAKLDPLAERLRDTVEGADGGDTSDTDGEEGEGEKQMTGKGEDQ